MPPPANSRQNNIDFLRFALAIIVIFSHSYDLLIGAALNPFKIATHGQIEIGSIAVDMFFILSGFLITQSWLFSRGLADFLFKRVLRIYPAFIVAGLLSLFVFGPIPAHFSNLYWDYVEPGKFTFSLLTLQPLWIPQSFKLSAIPMVNGAVWTIQYEFLCYLLVALLGLTTVLRSRAFSIALFLAVYAFFLLHTYADLWIYNWAALPVGGQPDQYPRFFTYFLAGVCFFHLKDKIPFNATGLTLSAFATLAGLFLFKGAEVVLPFTATYFVFWFAFEPTIRLQHFGKYGDFSYGLYVYGWPMQQLVILYTFKWATPLSVFFLSTFLALICGILSWYLVERPTLQFKNLFSKPQPKPLPETPAPQPQLAEPSL